MKQDFIIIIIILILNILRFRLIIGPVRIFEDELGRSIIFSIYPDLSYPFVDILGLTVVIWCFPFLRFLGLPIHLGILQFLELFSFTFSPSPVSVFLILSSVVSPRSVLKNSLCAASSLYILLCFKIQFSLP